MSKRVLFNGVVLVRPGAATKIDASAFEDVNLSGLGVVGLIGAADGGQPRVVKVFNSPGGVRNHYGSGDLVEAAAVVANPSNDNRITTGAQAIVCYKTNISTPATLNALNAAAGVPIVFVSRDWGLGTNNIRMTGTTDGGNGRLLLITDMLADGSEIQEQSPALGVNGKLTVRYVGAGAACTAEVTSTSINFAATGAAVAGFALATAGPHLVRPGDVINLTVDEGAAVPYTWAGTRGFKVMASGAFAGSVAGTFTIQWNGDATTAQTITFTGAQGAGIAAALATINAQIYGGFAFNSSGVIEFMSDRYGGSSNAQITAVTGSGFSAEYGISAGSAGTAGTVTLKKSSGGPTSVTVAFLDAITDAEVAAAFVVATQPAGGTLDASGPGGVLKFVTATTGASPKGVLVSGTNRLGFDNVEHNGTASGAIPGDSFSVLFANYSNLAALVRYVDGLPNYEATSLITNAAAFDPSQLDALTPTSILTTTALYARNFDVVDWTNTNSSLVSATLTKGLVGPIVAFPQTALSGGTFGTADNTAWANAFTAMGGLRTNQVVPLCSDDGVNVGDGTYTFASVSAGLLSHCRYYSSTAGRSERQGWIGMVGNKAAILAEATLLNSADVCLSAMSIQRFSAVDNNLVTLPEWGFAALCAGMRAGAPLSEPLTWKYINVQGISSDPSWDPQNSDDVVDMILGGVMLATFVANKGYRIERGITTYSRTDNDAYTEESLVQGWKGVAYDLRTFLEDRYTGRPGSKKMIRTVPDSVTAVMVKEEAVGVITADDDGPAWRGITYGLSGDQLTVGVTVVLTPGINFILNTLAIVPARFSSAAA